MHIRVLLSILPLVASSVAEAVPAHFAVSPLTTRSLGLNRRQTQVVEFCPVNTIDCRNVNGSCCEVGTRCARLGCCPIGQDCSLPSTCTARSDPNCASKEDCCPADRPYCNTTETGAAECSNTEVIGGGSGNGDGEDEGDDEGDEGDDGDDGEDTPPAEPTDTTSPTPTSTATEDDSAGSTTTSVSTATSTTSAEDTLTQPTFPNATEPTPISTATPLPSSSVTGTPIGDDEPPVQDGNAGARKSVGMSVLMGLGVVVGAVVML
jgi:hypothetical protein